MNKNLISSLSAAFITGLVIVFVTSRLLDKEPLFYVVTAVSALISILSIFFIVKNIINSLQKLSSKNDELFCGIIKKNQELENTLTDFVKTQDGITKLFSEFCVKTDSSLKSLEKIEQSVIEKNAEHINKLSEHIDNTIEKLQKANADENENQRREFAEQISKIIKLYSNCINDLKESIDNQMIAISAELKSLIKQSNDAMSEQREKTSEHLAKITESTEKAILNQIDTTFENLKSMQEAYNNTANAGIDTLNKLIKDFREISEKEHEEIKGEYHEMLTALQLELCDKLEYLNVCVKDSLKNSSESIVSHNKALLDKIVDITTEHMEMLKIHNSEAIFAASKQLMEDNKNIMNSQSEQFYANMNHFTQENEEIMRNNVQMLTQKTDESIERFIESSKDIFDENASKISKLVETEKVFIENYNQQNENLKEIIADCFSEYGENVTALSKDIESKIYDCISGEEKVYAQQLENLKSELQKYSDSFVDRSANAVVKEIEILRHDDSVKLKEMCSSIENLANTTNHFVNETLENDHRTTESIDIIIEQNKNFIDNMRTVNNEGLNSAKKILYDHLSSLKTEFSKLNAENSQTFSTSMENYREIFVKASADAVANVQHDNVSAITSAHEKLAELSNMIQDSQTQYSKLSSTVITILSETKNAISEGNEKTKKHYENQDEYLEERIENFERIFKDKLNAYNQKLEETLKMIVDLEDVIKQNTTSYHKTLEYITDSQNAINSLTSKDVEVLEKLVNK